MNTSKSWYKNYRPQKDLNANRLRQTLHSQPLIVEKLLVMVFSEYSIAY